MLSKLISQLCDGSNSDSPPLSNAQIAEILRSDPTAMDEYLDHAYLSGVLAQELGSENAKVVPSKSIATNARRRSFFTSIASVAASILLLCGFGWILSSDDFAATVDIVDLRRDGFESAIHHESHPSPESWHGDHSSVVGDWKGVSAPEGGKMLRLVRSSTAPEVSCDIFHVVSLKELQEYQTGTAPKVDASFLFNSLDEKGDGDYVFSLSLYSFPENPIHQGALLPLPMEEVLAFMTRQLIADSDVVSWQKLDTEIALPEETQYVVLQISVRHRERGGSDFEYPGQLIDDVQMKLTMQ